MKKWKSLINGTQKNFFVFIGVFPINMSFSCCSRASGNSRIEVVDCAVRFQSNASVPTPGFPSMLDTFLEALCWHVWPLSGLCHSGPLRKLMLVYVSQSTALRQPSTVFEGWLLSLWWRLDTRNCPSIWSCFRMFVRILFFFILKLSVSKTLYFSLVGNFKCCFSKLGNFSGSFWHLQIRPEFQTSRGFPKMLPKWSLVSSYICIRFFLCDRLSYPIPSWNYFWIRKDNIGCL